MLIALRRHTTIILFWFFSLTDKLLLLLPLLPLKQLLLLLHLQLLFLFLFHLAPHHLFLLESLLFLSLSLFFFGLLLLSLLLSLTLFLLGAFHFSPLLGFSLLGFSCSLGSSVCFGLCLSSSGTAIVLIFLLWWLLFFPLFAASVAKEFRDIGSGIDTCRSCPEHLLQPYVSFICLLTCQNHAWLDIDFLLDDQFSK